MSVNNVDDIFNTMDEAIGKWRINLNNELGRGMRAVVRPCEISGSREPECVKILADSERWKDELNAMKILTECVPYDLRSIVSPLIRTAYVSEWGETDALLLGMKRGGITLWEWGNYSRQPLRQWASILAQLLVGLHSINRCSVVHGDISPHNILVSHAGPRETLRIGRFDMPLCGVKVTIIDFGEARVVDDSTPYKYKQALKSRKDVLQLWHSILTWGARARLLRATGNTSTADYNLAVFMENDKGHFPLNEAPRGVSSEATGTMDAKRNTKSDVSLWQEFDRRAEIGSRAMCPLPYELGDYIGPLIFAKLMADPATRGYKMKFILPRETTQRMRIANSDRIIEDMAYIASTGRIPKSR